MKTCLVYLILSFSIIRLSAQDASRTNLLKEVFSVPDHGLPASSQAAAGNFGYQLLKACGPGNGIWEDKGRLANVFKAALLPSLMPLKTGNASEKKIFEAALTVEKAFEYASDNMIDNGPWGDKELNKLLRLNGKPGKSDDVFHGLYELTTDFLQISCPAPPEQK